METTVLGYPRTSAPRRQLWETLRDAGLSAIPSGPRADYLPSELGPDTDLRLAGDSPVREYREALSLGIEIRPVLPGPLSFLLLPRAAEPGFAPLSLLEPLLDAYEELLADLASAGAQWVQFDEPALTAGLAGEELKAVGHAYHRLGSLRQRPKLLVSTCSGEIEDALAVLADSPVEAIGLDFVAAPGNAGALAAIGGIGGKTLVAGVVDGGGGERSDLPAALSLCTSLLDLAGELTVSTSCSLPPGPAGPDGEMSLARLKAGEVVTLGRWLSGDRVLLGPPCPPG